MPGIEHQLVAGAVLAWMMKRPGGHVGACEVGCPLGQLDVVAVSAAPEERELVNREQELRKSHTKRWSPVEAPRVRVPWVGIAEVKASRADLLADLRARKMHRYSGVAGHAWLALTAPCLLAERGAWVKPEALEGLDLPDRWGVLLVDPDVRGGVRSLRPARRLRPVEEQEAAGWRSRVARSLTWRTLRAGGHVV